MSDWWIDETPPRDPPEIHTLDAFKQATLNFGRQLGRMFETFDDFFTKVLYETTPAPETTQCECKEELDPTKRVYPTSSNPTQTRRNYKSSRR